MVIGSIFVWKVKRITNLDYRKFICQAVFAANSHTRKMLKIILKKEENLISSHNVHIGVGTTRIISKCTTMQALEVRKFKQNAQKFLIHQVEKSKEHSLLCYKYTYYTVVNMSCLFDKFFISHFIKLSLLLSEQVWITTLCADCAEASYKLLRLMLMWKTKWNIIWMKCWMCSTWVTHPPMSS